MHARHKKANIPIELLRTFVTCVDTGTVTKAAQALGLTQSAASNQIKRLESILGGAVFRKRDGGFLLTARGEAVLSNTRRLLALNDQILALAGPKPTERQYRIGIPRYIATRMLGEIIQSCKATGENVYFQCDSQEELTRGLNRAFIDFAYLCNSSSPPGVPSTEWSEQSYWVKSPSLTVAADEPIPLVGGTGILHRVATRVLEEADIAYVMTFTSQDLAARLSAVEHGLGVMLVTERSITQRIEIMRGKLPPPPRITTGVYLREGLNQKRIAPLLRAFETAVRPRGLPRFSRDAPVLVTRSPSQKGRSGRPRSA